MLKLRKVAVTGGLSCGKSSVCHLLKNLGAYVVSADEIVHQLLSTHTTLGQDVIKLLGSDIVVNGYIDRKRMAQLVFHNTALLQGLETLLHPAVRDEIEKYYQQVKNPPYKLFVAEIPLLYETGGEGDYDATIVVTAFPEVCRERFKASTGYPDAEFDRRMERQWDVPQKVKKATYVISNNGNLDELKKSVETLFSTLTQNP